MTSKEIIRTNFSRIENYIDRIESKLYGLDDPNNFESNEIIYINLVRAITAIADIQNAVVSALGRSDAEGTLSATELLQNEGWIGKALADEIRGAIEFFDTYLKDWGYIENNFLEQEAYRIIALLHNFSNAINEKINLLTD
jgi:uncharacterized protein YutE (UPF0331/DUF86 family)